MISKAIAFSAMKLLIAITAATLAAVRPGIAAADLAQTFAFDIAPQKLPTALLKFSEQSGVQVTSPAEIIDQKTSAGVVGSFPAREALDRLLAGTELSYEVVDPGTVAIRATAGKANGTAANTVVLERADQKKVSADNPEDSEPSTAALAGTSEEITVFGKIPEVLVRGSRSLNMDIRRSRDDVQPYVVYGAEEIARSGASTVEDFLKKRLTMNTQATAFSQTPDSLGNTSRINLRGLGTDETLILIDGRRAASGSITSLSLQSDLNGIPLSAIERIEVLPTTASGIYGGSATGGVVNIVLRRDYSGVEVSLSYDNTFDTDSAARHVNLNSGFSLEDGKTTILLAGYYSDANFLLVRDRDLVQRGRAAIQENNPLFFSGSITPPLGSTTNIRSVSGAPLFGPGTPNFTSVPAGYAGGGGVAPLQANAGQYNLELSGSAQAGGGMQGLVNAPTIESLMATVRRQFGPAVEAFVEVSGANNVGVFPTSRLTGTYTIQANAPNNPFGQAIRVTVPTAGADGVVRSTSQDRRIVGGVIVRLGESWSAEVDYTVNKVRNEFSAPGNPATESAAIAAGQLDVLRDTNASPLHLAPYGRSPNHTSPFRSALKNATLRVAGPVGSLPGGKPTLAALIEHRSEDFDGGTQFINPIPIFYPDRSQSAKSLYVEARVPLISDRNERKGARELEFQVAARHDDYTVKSATALVLVGSPAPIARSRSELQSTNPTIGLRYRPIPSVMFRSSYGTGFLPPSAQQLLPFGVPANVAAGSAVDPRRGNAQTPALQELQGGNPNLEPEESESWSAGVVLEPAFARGLRLSIDYTRIEKDENIFTLPRQTLIDNEALFPSRITRAPATPGDPFGVGPITALDRTLINIAKAQVEAYDVQLDYRKDVGAAGAFDFFALATWQTKFDTQLLPTAPTVENVGISSSNPLEFRANAGLSWSHGGWTVGWSARYFDDYLVADPALASSAVTLANQGSGGVVASQTYHDAFARYSFGPVSSASRSRSLTSSVLGNTEIQLSFRNVFNERPPLDVNSSALFPYFYSPHGDPRLASYSISVRRVF